MKLKNPVDDSKPQGLFHGGMVCGKAVYHGDGGQKITIDNIEQRESWPDKMTAEELQDLSGSYYPFGSLH